MWFHCVVRYYTVDLRQQGERDHTVVPRPHALWEAEIGAEAKEAGTTGERRLG